MALVSEDVCKRALGRVIEGLDDIRPPLPYKIAEVVAKAEGEPAVKPMMMTLESLDKKHPGWNLTDHQRHYMGTTCGALLRSTDAIGRRTHGRIWDGRGAARYFSLKAFTLEQVQAMRIGGRKYERHVKVRNDGFEELERLMVLHGAKTVEEVWDDWRPAKEDDPGVAV
jgi:hypothetical protein